MRHASNGAHDLSLRCTLQSERCAPSGVARPTCGQRCYLSMPCLGNSAAQGAPRASLVLSAGACGRAAPRPRVLPNVQPCQCGANDHSALSSFQRSALASFSTSSASNISPPSRTRCLSGCSFSAAMRYRPRLRRVQHVHVLLVFREVLLEERLGGDDGLAASLRLRKLLLHNLGRLLLRGCSRRRRHRDLRRLGPRLRLRPRLRTRTILGQLIGARLRHGECGVS